MTVISISVLVDSHPCNISVLFLSLAIATPQLGYKYKLTGYTDSEVIGKSTVPLYLTACPCPDTPLKVIF